MIRRGGETKKITEASVTKKKGKQPLHPSASGTSNRVHLGKEKLRGGKSRGRQMERRRSDNN